MEEIGEQGEWWGTVGIREHGRELEALVVEDRGRELGLMW